MSLDKLIDVVLADADYRNNPYFLNLENGQFAKADFVETQIQFFFAVSFFSRPMAAVVGRIPTPELRMEVLRNVWEEHGEGNLSFGHESTFIEFLSRIGQIPPNQIGLRGLWPEIRIFNTTLAGASVLDDYLISVAMLGMIERMFSDISGWIGKAIVKRGWLTDDTMIHYKLHEALDVKHSQDFFNILSAPFEKSELNRYHVEQGLRLGATVFNEMYRGLWRARERRWILSKEMPPSMSADYVR